MNPGGPDAPDFRPPGLIPLIFLAATAAAAADEPGYELRIDSSLEGGKLSAMPHITAPAGASLRYEVVSAKEGPAGKSSTSQAGRVSVGSEGSARLSRLTLGVGPDDRYRITVKVFDGAKLVAEEALSVPP